MTKRKFLAKLESSLSSLNAEERSRQLDYYEEMIDDMMDDGLSEEEAVSRLGSVQGVAAKILSTASPDMLKKSRSPLKKILIALAIVVVVIIAGTVLLFGLFKFDHNAGIQQLDDIDDIVEERMELDEGWLLGGDASFEADTVKSVDIVWGCGDIYIGEAEGGKIVVKVGKVDVLKYQTEDGVLYIENDELSANKRVKLEILLPEDGAFFDKLSVVTSVGNVYLDYEDFALIEAVTDSGKITIEESEASDMNIVTASGDVMINADEDDAFVLDYATDTGDVSVSFDRHFKNESGGGKEAHYDHSFGSSNCRRYSTVTATGDIRLLDD